MNRVNMFPEKVRIFPELEDRDTGARNSFANWWLQNIQSDF